MARVSLTSMQSNDDLVTRLKNSDNHKFTTLVTMHLSFLLDLPGCSLEELTEECSNVEPERRMISVFGRKRNNKDQTKVFGVALSQHVIDRIIPIMDYLGQIDNLKQEGLFRKSGNLDRQRLLRDELNGDDVVDLATSEYTAHDCANVLKTFLGEIPDPVMMENHYTAHCQIAEMSAESKRLETLQLLVQLLPTENATLLQHLLDLLHRVANESDNLMTEETLAVLFVPHIIVPRKTPACELQKVSVCFTSIVALMISKSDSLFSYPETLVRDVAHHYHDTDCSYDDGDISQHPPSSKRDENSDDEVVCTTVTFADRRWSQQAATQFNTEKAHQELYAHVLAMTESATKRKLLKQFQKLNCPGTPVNNSMTQHKNTPSIKQSIKRLISKRKRDATLLVKEEETPTDKHPIYRKKCLGDDTETDVARTPVKKLFTVVESLSPVCQQVVRAKVDIVDVRQCTIRQTMTNENSNSLSYISTVVNGSRHCLRVSRNSSPVTTAYKVLPAFTAVTDNRLPAITTLDNRLPAITTLDDRLPAITTLDERLPVTAAVCDDRLLIVDKTYDDADTENIFPFHSTPSIVALEKIFAKQRSPSFEKPRGFISPLRIRQSIAQSVARTQLQSPF